MPESKGPKLEFEKCVCGRGSAPNPTALGSLQRSPDPLAGLGERGEEERRGGGEKGKMEDREK